MNYPSKKEALDIIENAKKTNPGQWIDHSFNVALASEIISNSCDNLDSNKAYILGLLHDIGRSDKKKDLRHCYDGYIMMKNNGYDDVAKISLTHGFPNKEVLIIGGNDLNIREINEINNYLSSIEYDDYDKLIHLCDLISYPNGFVLLEKRLLDIGLRKGFNDNLLKFCNSALNCKIYFETKIKKSIYKLLPNVIENTFI